VRAPILLTRAKLGSSGFRKAMIAQIKTKRRLDLSTFGL